MSANEVAFGKNWRSKPLVFSFVPRCHGEYGSQKYTFIPVASASFLCAANSLPLSTVELFFSLSGIAVKA